MTRLLPIGAAILFALLGAASHWVNPSLEYQRGALAGFELWRLATAHLAHLDAWHGALNGAALVLVWRMGRDVVSPAQWAWLLLGAVVAVDAGLYWLSPAVEWYVGASGVLHGLFAGMATLALAGTQRRFGTACLVALAVKLAWEALAGEPASGVLLGDAPVVTVAHLYGSVGGWATAVLLSSVARIHADAT